MKTKSQIWPSDQRNKAVVAQRISTDKEIGTKAHKMNFDSTQMTRILNIIFSKSRPIRKYELRQLKSKEHTRVRS